MKLAFCLFNYFPFGGLQRDFLRIARACIQRGHHVDAYTMEWKGEVDPSISVNLIAAQGWQNHTRSRHFVKQLNDQLTAKKYDLIVGFNKMPGLDVYYAADTCYQAKALEERPWWYRLTPRYKQWVDYEKAVFDKDHHTKILLIAAKQQQKFQHYYGTPESRFYVLPPGIAKDRIAPSNANEIREALRKEWNINRNEFLLLMVGSGFKVKGLDRIIKGIAALPTDLQQRCRLFVIGDGHADAFVKQADHLGISQRIQFLGGRHDVPHFLLAADLLLHPAYMENTGTVLLEAVISGLPVLTNDVCGYADYVQQAGAGKVLSSPFSQIQFNESLMDMLLSAERERFRQNGLSFAKTADIYSMPERVADILESL